jgi:hypothetical protein
VCSAVAQLIWSSHGTRQAMIGASLVTLRKRRRMLGCQRFSPSTWTHLAVAHCPPAIMAAKNIAGLVTGWAVGQGWRIRSSPRCKTATEPARLASSVRLARSLIVLVTVAAD